MDSTQIDIKTYKRRWFVLATFSILNVSNASIWISYASVANIVAQYYNVTQDDINWFSTIFLISAVPIGILAMWLIDIKLGLKKAIYIGAAFNTIGAGLRTLSSTSLIPSASSYGVALTGQTLAAIGQPFLFFLPTQIAEFWFPEGQRTLATMIGAMGQPLGMLISNVVGPTVVKSTSDVFAFNIIWFSISILAQLFVFIFIRSSRPPHPPSISACFQHAMPFWQSLKQLLTNKPYLLLMLYMGCSVGSFSVLVSLMEQLLCVYGYSDFFSGILCVVMIISGFVGSGIAGLITDKFKNFIDVMKVSVAFTCIGLCIFQIIFRYSNLQWALILTGIFINFFGFASYPVGLELAVECSYPVTSESTSAGFIMISSQIQGFLLMVIMPLLATDLKYAPLSVCSKTNDALTHEMTNSMLFFASFNTFCGAIFILFFSTEYKRILAELARSANNILKADYSE